MRRLREGRALVFDMEAMLSADIRDIATAAVSEQDDANPDHRTSCRGKDVSCVVFAAQTWRL
jgi:hypothetical protein